MRLPKLVRPADDTEGVRVPASVVRWSVVATVALTFLAALVWTLVTR